ncbi:MAG TPA: DUF4142 domain-containing protein [Beijerinckiaceae bacterium]|nr:DUF4142 domain-containing protein [Methylobacteriaceae bacterium]HRY04755.1 DUF4142 domain-containing protein [Beijerinckiaceae bacterium]
MKYVLLAVAALVITPAFAQSDASREFLKEAIQGDNAEIQMGQLAAARGGSKDVRDFGKMLSRDHQKAAAQARKVATQMKMKAPAGIPDAAKEEKAKLRKLKGADFDKEFASYMVEDHRKDIDEFQREAEQGENPKVKEMAAAQLPTLKKHLEAAQKLAASGQ